MILYQIPDFSTLELDPLRSKLQAATGVPSCDVNTAGCGEKLGVSSCSANSGIVTEEVIFFFPSTDASIPPCELRSGSQDPISCEFDPPVVCENGSGTLWTIRCTFSGDFCSTNITVVCDGGSSGNCILGN